MAEHTAPAASAEGVTETVYFRRTPYDAEDSLVVPFGEACRHVRQELITRIVKNDSPAASLREQEAIPYKWPTFEEWSRHAGVPWSLIGMYHHVWSNARAIDSQRRGREKENGNG